MDGRRERCLSINGLTMRALNNFGSAWPSSFSGAQSATSLARILRKKTLFGRDLEI